MYSVGLKFGLSFADYQRIDAINHSRLRPFRKTAMHAQWNITHPDEPSDDQEVGSAVHCAILEPERFKAEYCAAPDVDRRSKAGKQEWEDFQTANRGKEILTADDFSMCIAMSEAFWRSDSVAVKMLRGVGKNEVTAVWTDAETGLKCKGRMDRINPFMGATIVDDIKTTQDASPDGFSREISKWSYHTAAAFYLDGLNAIAESSRHFCLIAIEKKPPYAVGCYMLEQDAINEGRKLVRSWLHQYAAARQTNLWPGYSTAIEPISLPKWAFTMGDM